MVMVFTAIVCGSRRYFSRLSMLSSLPTHLQMNGLPPLTITHRIGLFVLHVVTRVNTKVRAMIWKLSFLWGWECVFVQGDSSSEPLAFPSEA
jgi:hypothetical protein